MSFFNFTHLSAIIGNDKRTHQRRLIQNKKLNDIGLNGNPDKHDPDKVIFNYTSHNPTDAEKS